jgi:hypothetical protein
MRATTERPKVSGWYWYRAVGPGPNPTKGPWGLSWIGDIEIRNMRLRVPEGEWSDEPIPYPEEND